MGGVRLPDAGGMAWTAPALPPRVRDALGMAVAAARQSQPGMFATLSVREGVLLALLAGATPCSAVRRQGC